MAKTNGAATWKWALGVSAPIVVALIVWGVHVENRIAVLELGQKVLLAELKRIAGP